jgi:hypothetical protein
MSADLSEMVARAICLAEGRDPDLEDNNVADGVFLPNWTRFDQSARAALSIAEPIIRRDALMEAANMVKESFEGACYEGMSRFIEAEIRKLSEAE